MNAIMSLAKVAWDFEKATGKRLTAVSIEDKDWHGLITQSALDEAGLDYHFRDEWCDIRTPSGWLHLSQSHTVKVML